MSNVESRKQEVRKLVKQLKKELSVDEKMRQSKMIFEQIEHLIEFQEANSLALYWSLPDEVSTHDFIQKWFSQKNIYLPVINGNELDFKRYVLGGELLPDDRFGIPEPQGEKLDFDKTLDLIIVPAIAFDNYGNRLGRGGGFYDRTLKRYSGVFKLGIGFNIQKVEEIPIEAFDVKLDKVIFGA